MTARNRALDLIGVLDGRNLSSVLSRHQSKRIAFETNVALVENALAAERRATKKAERARVFRIVKARACTQTQGGDDDCDCDVCTTLRSVLAAVIRKKRRKR